MKKKKNVLHIYWIIPIMILLILFFFLFTTNKTNIKCGDGNCDISEISFCGLDCKENCINTTQVATKGTEIIECSKGWEQAYYDVLLQKNISLDYLKETELVDYSHPDIQSLAKQLKKGTAKETAKAIAQWTYQNIKYDENNDYFECYNIKASEILERKYGLCSTQSRINLALLRANGIPSRTITGCFTYKNYCKIIQTMFRKPIPTIFPIEVDKSGYVSTRGGLHNFVQILLPEENDWIILESTIGLLYDSTCINYKFYYTSEETITPDSPEVCGLPPTNPLVEDCKNWI